MTIYIKKEERSERDDVFTIYTIDKVPNEQKTAFVDAEIPLKENYTLQMLQAEIQTKQEQISQLENEIAGLNEMVALASTLEKL